MNLSLQLQKNKTYDQQYLSRSLQLKHENLDPLLEERELINSVKDLNEIQKNLASLVNNQQEHLDLIQNNISQTEEQSINALEDLKEADRLFFSYKPIFIGGTLGLLVGGPMGLLVGVKWTGLTSGIGSALGGYAGYKAQKN
jgi:hypothetical protein